MSSIFTMKKCGKVAFFAFSCTITVSTQELQPRSSTRQLQKEMTAGETFGIVVGAMLVVSLILLSQWLFIRSRNVFAVVGVGNNHAPPLSQPVQNQSSWHPSALFSSATTRLSKEMYEQRVKFIESSIIKKKVYLLGSPSSCSSSKVDALEIGQKSIHENETVVSGRLRSTNHKVCLSSNHSNHPASKAEEDDISHFVDEEYAIRIRKDDIYIETCSLASAFSIRQNMRIAASSHHSLLSPKSCPICFERFRKGDEISWSKNNDCLHCFHLQCITQWLIYNDECPMCRFNYLSSSNASCGNSILEFPLGIPQEIAVNESNDSDQDQDSDENEVNE